MQTSRAGGLFADNRVKLMAVFGALAFLQGLVEPTEGLASQPVRVLQGDLGHGPGAVALFSSLMALPWVLKPVFGLMMDLCPINGSRRKAYLILGGALLAISYTRLAATGPASLLFWLALAAIGATIADVATDALVVEWGQVHDRTGPYQSVSWFGLYASGVLAGSAGGRLSAGSPRMAFPVVAAGSALLLVLSLFTVSESKEARIGLKTPRRPLRSLAVAARSPGVLAVAAFLALWNFNPFSNAILHLHMRGALAIDEPFYGHTLSLFSLACMIAAAGYGVYCRRVSMRILFHASIWLGIAQSLAYAAMAGRTSAMIVTIFAGLTWMTANLIQLDLAARACPPGTAATVFASLMAVSNLSTLLATALGGLVYERAGAHWSPMLAFQLLVAAGAITTAMCWLILPWIPPKLFHEANVETE